MNVDSRSNLNMLIHLKLKTSVFNSDGNTYGIDDIGDISLTFPCSQVGPHRNPPLRPHWN